VGDEVLLPPGYELPVIIIKIAQDLIIIIGDRLSQEIKTDLNPDRIPGQNEPVPILS